MWGGQGHSSIVQIWRTDLTAQQHLQHIVLPRCSWKHLDHTQPRASHFIQSIKAVRMDLESLQQPLTLAEVMVCQHIREQQKLLSDTKDSLPQPSAADQIHHNCLPRNELQLSISRKLFNPRRRELPQSKVQISDATEFPLVFQLNCPNSFFSNKKQGWSLCKAFFQWAPSCWPSLSGFMLLL